MAATLAVQVDVMLRSNLEIQLTDTLHDFFYKHMKFRNQARLCLAIYDFEAHIMLSLTFQGAGLPACKKFNSNMIAKCESL